MFFVQHGKTHKLECGRTSQSMYTHGHGPLSFRERKGALQSSANRVKKEYSGIKSNPHRLRMHFEIERN